MRPFVKTIFILLFSSTHVMFFNNEIHIFVLYQTADLVAGLQADLVDKLTEISELAAGIDRVFEPKCYEELSKLLEEYEDVDTRLADKLDLAAITAAKYNASFTENTHLYENNSIKLVTVSQLIDL